MRKGEGRPRAALLPRLQLVELTDLAGTPAFIRRYLTEYLATVIRLSRCFDPLVPLLAELAGAAGTATFIDLCSGSGGPYAHLARPLAAHMTSPPTIVLSDRFPQPECARAIRSATGVDVRYAEKPVDARAVPRDLAGVRTIFDGLHHFRPADARALLADAAQQRQPIVAAEAVARTLPGVLGMLLTPLVVLLLTPAIRPFSFWRLVVTYVVPLIPLAVMFDGVVSSLRAYRPAELRALAGDAPAGYAFEVRELRAGANRITVLVGRPLAEGTA